MFQNPGRALGPSNTLWAFASLRHYHEGLFEALLGRLVGHLDEAEPQNVANCLYAFARVNHSLGQHTGVWRRGGSEGGAEHIWAHPGLHMGLLQLWVVGL